MKQGSFTAIRLIVCITILALASVFSAFGDDITEDLEGLMLEAFNGDSDYTWKLEASKFASKVDDTQYPMSTYVEAWPIAVFGYNRDGSKDIKSFGIHGKFDRRGYNWIDIYPTKEGEDGPAEIPIPGRLRYLDMWVWGSNLDFYIEAYLRDYQGVVHNIKLGNIGFAGWKNLRAYIPGSIRQSKRQLPRYAGLTFVKFRLWTQPTEGVGDFYVYFKNFKTLTDTFESLYDGDELADPDHVQELWANSDGGSN